MILSVEDKFQIITNQVKAAGLFSVDEIGPAEVLRAYGCFVAMGNFPANVTIDERYRRVYGLEPPENMTSYSVLHNSFRNTTINELLHLMPKGYLANPQEICEQLSLPTVYAELKKHDVSKEMNRIIKSKEILHKTRSSEHLAHLVQAASLPKGTELQNEHLSEDDISWLSERKNFDLFVACNFLHLARKPASKHSGAVKKIREVNKDLSDQIDAAIRFFDGTSNAYIKEQMKYSMHHIREMRRIDPLDALSNLTINRDENDLIIEDNLLLPEMMALRNEVKGSHVLYVNPSANLIQKCCELQDKLPRITFCIVDNKQYQLSQFSNTLLACKGKINCISIEDRISLLKRRTNQNTITHAIFNYSSTIYRKDILKGATTRWAGWLAPSCKIIALMGRPSTKNETAKMFVSGVPNLRLHTVSLLPNGLPWSSYPKRKVIITYDYARNGVFKSNECFAMRQYNLVEVDKNSAVKLDRNRKSKKAMEVDKYLYMREYHNLEVSLEALESDDTLMQVYKQLKIQERRETTIEISLSRELTIHYKAVRKSESDVGRIWAYMTLNGSNILGAHNTKVVIRSAKKFNEIITNLEQWAREVYPFFSRSKDDNVMSIREKSSMAFLSAEERPQLNSLRGLWYLDMNFEKNFSPEYRDYLHNTIISTQIGDEPLHITTQQDFDSYHNNVYSNRTLEEGDLLFNLLSQLYQLAVEKEYCKSHPNKWDRNKIKQSKRRRRQEVRDSNARHSLTIEEMQRLYENLSPDLGDPYKLAVLTTMLMGLRPGEICALTQEDFIYFEELGFYVVCIQRTLPYSGNEPVAFEERHQYRFVACPPIIARHLQALSKQLPVELTDKERKKSPLFFDQTKSAEGKKHDYCSVSKVARECRLALKSLGIPKDEVELPDDDGDYTSTDLSQKKSLLRSNFEYYARQKCMLTEGEIASILGRISDTIMGKHYISYNDAFSLYIQYIKSKRMADLLYAIPTDKKHQVIGDEHEYLINPLGAGCTSATVRLNIPRNRKLHLKIDTQHGAAAVASILYNLQIMEGPR